METYPNGYLPEALFDYAGDSEQTGEIIEFDAGNRRSIRHSSNIREVYDLTFMFSNAEMDFWRGWHKHKINNGADSFLMDLILNDQTQQFLVQIDRGKYQQTRVSHEYWQVTYSVVIDDTKMMTEAELDAILNP